MTTNMAEGRIVEPVATLGNRGGGGPRLQAQEWGNPDEPEMLFIHGWSQCDLCWSSQVARRWRGDIRMVTFDLRGHGRSEKPSGGEALHTTTAVGGRCRGRDPADRARATGRGRLVIRGVHRRGLLPGLWRRRQWPGSTWWRAVILQSAGLRPHRAANTRECGGASAPDLATNIAAIRRFLRACSAEALDAREWTTGAVLEHGRSAGGPWRADLT